MPELSPSPTAGTSMEMLRVECVKCVKCVEIPCQALGGRD